LFAAGSLGLAVPTRISALAAHKAGATMQFVKQNSVTDATEQPRKA
jgi:hypothetical protein